MEYEIGRRYGYAELDGITAWCRANPRYALDTYEDYIEMRERDVSDMQFEIRLRRNGACFSVINRGELWYSKLTDNQKTELSAWYDAWLDAPATLIIPEPPAWLE